MGKRRDLTEDDLETLRMMYHSEEYTVEEICDMFSFSPGSIRQFASRRDWLRPKCFYRNGVEKKPIPEERRETAKVLWDSGESCKRIAKWIGVSENTARELCCEEFGYRNLRLNKATYYARRNTQMKLMYKRGAKIEDLADYFWLGIKTVRDLLRKQGVNLKEVHFAASMNYVLKDERIKELELGEKIVTNTIGTVARELKVAGQYIMWPTRGKKKIAFARQTAMYVVHCHAGYSLTRTGLIFGRDRTTVGHACVTIENARDDYDFDMLVDKIADDLIKNVEELTITPP